MKINVICIRVLFQAKDHIHKGMKCETGCKCTLLHAASERLCTIFSVLPWAWEWRTAYRLFLTVVVFRTPDNINARICSLNEDKETAFFIVPVYVGVRYNEICDL